MDESCGTSMVVVCDKPKVKLHHSGPTRTPIRPWRGRRQSRKERDRLLKESRRLARSPKSGQTHTGVVMKVPSQRGAGNRLTRRL